MRSVFRINKLTRDIEGVYPSVTSAARSAGMRGKRMDDLCRKRNLPPGTFYYRFADDFDRDESFEGKRNRPVVLVDASTGFKLWFADRAECAKTMGWSAARVSSSISSGQSSLLGGQYVARYVNMRPMTKRGFH